MKEQAIFVQLSALAEAAILALENGKEDAVAGVLYTMQDVLKAVLDYYPSKANSGK